LQPKSAASLYLAPDATCGASLTCFADVAATGKINDSVAAFAIGFVDREFAAIVGN